MKVLVTGAGGALGRHVVHHLRALGHTVSVLLHPTDDDGAAWAGEHLLPVHRADVCDEAAVGRAVVGQEAVVHLAGVAGVRLSDAPRMRRTNVLGAAVVAAACRRAGARLVHMSSASAVGLSPTAEPIEEDFTLPTARVRHAYPLSKLRGQQAVARAIREGLAGVILNPGAVLAPGDPRANAWSALPRVIRSGLRWAPPGGFGFVGRASLLEAVEQGLSAPPNPEPTLVVDQSASYQAVFTLVARAVGAGPVRTLPTAPVRAGLGAAGLVRRLPGPAARLDADPTLTPFLTWPNVYGGARSRTRLSLRQRPLRDAVADLVHPLPNGTPR